ncbi:MAG: carboxypeptidase-like regulatory domain-containing protein, partial [Bacteroidales bacterium]|nr:carboxypeptidase-like regulatory domain-containing protein [Bacteroidales bacterium]
MRSISIKLAFAAVLMFCAVASAMAQGTVKGIVVDADNGAPLLGTSVYIDGTTQGTVSGGNGEFTLKVRTAKARIVFSFVGYVEDFRDVEVGGGEIDLGTIALKPSTVGV